MRPWRKKRAKRNRTARGRCGCPMCEVRHFRPREYQATVWTEDPGRGAFYWLPESERQRALAQLAWDALDMIAPRVSESPRLRRD